MTGFGSMLRDYLEYYKISQTDFADRLGISQKHMNEIINGKTKISPELMILISLLTNIDVNLIFFAEKRKDTYDELINTYKSEKEINNMLKNYYLKDLSDKKWIKLKHPSSFVQNYLDLIEYLGVKDTSIINSYLDKRYLFKKTNNRIFDHLELETSEPSIVEEGSTPDLSNLVVYKVYSNGEREEKGDY